MSIIYLLLLLVSLFFGGQPPPADGEQTAAQAATQSTPAALSETGASPIENPTETPTVSQTERILTNINTVAVNVLESDPPQLSLDISGEHPDGCQYPVQVEQQREGSTIRVAVYRELPLDVFCPMVLQPYQGRVQLEGGYESGEYTIHVNSHTQTIQI